MNERQNIRLYFVLLHFYSFPSHLLRVHAISTHSLCFFAHHIHFAGSSLFIRSLEPHSFDTLLLPSHQSIQPTLLYYGSEKEINTAIPTITNTATLPQTYNKHNPHSKTITHNTFQQEQEQTPKSPSTLFLRFRHHLFLRVNGFLKNNLDPEK